MVTTDRRTQQGERNPVDPDRHLATYGAWNPTAFYSLATEANRVVVILLARRANDPTADNTREGCVVRHLWNAALRALPGAIGHRLSWRELVFFAPNAPIPDVVRTIAPLTLSPDPGVEICAAVQMAPLEPELRACFCEELVMGLAEAEHRRLYPDAWCIFGGTGGPAM